MIYLIGGAPRTGKSILGQRIAVNLKIGWTSTDLLMEMLRIKNIEGAKTEWDATPKAIKATADWFFPCVERFVWSISSLTKNYLIEGVDFLPMQIAQLFVQYQIRSVLLGCSKMTLERFDRYPGRSLGCASLPKKMRQQFAQDIPLWSAFIRQEAERSGYLYVDMSDDFPSRLREAEAMLTVNV